MGEKGGGRGGGGCSLTHSVALMSCSHSVTKPLTAVTVHLSTTAGLCYISLHNVQQFLLMTSSVWL